MDESADGLEGNTPVPDTEREPGPTPEPETAGQARPAAFEIPVGVRQRLHPNIRWAWRLAGFITTFLLVIASVLVDVIGIIRPVPPGALPVGVLAVGLLLAWIWPPLRYRGWSYTVRPKDVLVGQGVLWRIQTCIPRTRIQHVDIESGPLERAMGLCHLSLYTAGTAAAVVAIVGLDPEVAESLREVLLAEHGAKA